MTSERIDSHHHLWRYSSEEYGWISPEMQVLARDFVLLDLEKVLPKAGVAGSVAVQARQTLQETEWLLSLARDSEVVRGVVGWVPLTSERLPGVLESLRIHPKLKGLRHVVQDELDDAFMSRADFNRGIGTLTSAGLVYDILIYPRHLPEAIDLVDRHPNQVFVLDHMAKPLIREAKLDPWREHIAQLARRENVYCKISGMVTEADWANWHVRDLRPYFDVVLQSFGPRRLMAGSDWPVCLLASGYDRWFQTLEQFTTGLSANEKDLIFGRVALGVYKLQGAR